MKVIATTASAIKVNSIQKILKPSSIISISTAGAALPAQPINSGFWCCSERINYVKSLIKTEYDIIVSIENGIDTINHFDKGGDHGHFVDICYVIIEDRQGNRYSAESYGIPIPCSFVNEAQLSTSTDYKHQMFGYEVTAGSRIHLKYPEIMSDDWMKHPLFFGKSRSFQIEDALMKCAKK